MKELCVNVSDNSISNIYIENGLISKAGKLIKEKFNFIYRKDFVDEENFV